MSWGQSNTQGEIKIYSGREEGIIGKEEGEVGVIEMWSIGGRRKERMSISGIS